VLNRRTGSLIAGLFALALSASSASADAPAVRAVEVGKGESWEGQQYVGADGKGRVFVLRPQALRVYPLRDDGLGSEIALEAVPFAGPAPVLDAAMAGEGDWVALFGGEVRWFRSREEETLPPLHWAASAVALVDGRPVVAVYPSPVGRVSRRDLDVIPFLVTPDGDGWTVLVESEYEELPRREERFDARVRHAVRLTADSQDDLWVAYTYRYRLAHYSAAGRELLNVEMDGAEIGEAGEKAVGANRRALEEERARYAEPREATIHVNRAEVAIRDLTEGRDGRIYLLVKAKDGNHTHAIDRFDPPTGTLERTPLALDLAGAASIAAGKDGLYVVPFNGERRRWKVAWEDLDAAVWEAVPGVRIDGFEMPATP